MKYAAIIGSYGWQSSVVEQIAGLIPNLKVEVIDTVMQKGLPTDETYKPLDALAAAVAEAHTKDENVLK